MSQRSTKKAGKGFRDIWVPVSEKEETKPMASDSVNPGIPEKRVRRNINIKEKDGKFVVSWALIE